jgi:hypothetical protein
MRRETSNVIEHKGTLLDRLIAMGVCSKLTKYRKLRSSLCQS